MKGIKACTTLIIIFLQGFNVSICFDTYMWATRYSRSYLGRILLQQLEEEQRELGDIAKQLEEEQRALGDIAKWYECHVSKFDENLRSKFIQFDMDEESESFLKSCCEKGNNVFTQMTQAFLKGFFTFFMSVTTTNGILGRGSMFVFSKSQFLQLMRVDPDWKTDTLLDLGAGDGHVTAIMANYFEKVYVTEQSPSMRWRLRQQGFHVLEIEDWANNTYNVISCLNLLDRCDKPLSILADIRKALDPNRGRLIVAVVLPFSPCVESGSNILQPSEQIELKGQSWEEQATSFINDVLLPAGFLLESFARLPYLCEGDIYHDYYVLSDAVFVLRPRL